MTSPGPSDPWASRTRWLAVVAGLFVAALVTRLFELGQAPLIADEHFSYLEAHERARGLRNPANYGLIALMFDLFGRSELTARLPSFVFGVLSVPVLALTWQSVFGRPAAALAALLAVASSWHLWFSQFSRFYAAVFLLGTISYFLFYRAIRTGRKRYFFAVLGVNLVGVLFQLVFILVPVSCAVFCLAVLMHPVGRGCSRRTALAFVAVHALAVLPLLPLLSEILVRWAGRGPVWGYSPAGLLLQTAKYMQLPIAVTAVLGLLDLLRRDRLQGLYFAVATGVPLAVALLGSLAVSIRPDYIYFTFPLVLLLSAHLVERVRLKLGDRRLLALAVPVLVFGGMAPELVSHYSAKRTLDFREAVAYVEAHRGSGDRVLSFVAGYLQHAGEGVELEPRPGSPHFGAIDWDAVLRPYAESQRRLWILVEVNRNPLSPDLERWLGEHTSLVWRDFETRYDYSVRGYEIYLKRGPGSERPIDRREREEAEAEGGAAGAEEGGFVPGEAVEPVAPELPGVMPGSAGDPAGAAPAEPRRDPRENTSRNLMTAMVSVPLPWGSTVPTQAALGSAT